jgi:hypothetical protein
MCPLLGSGAEISWAIAAQANQQRKKKNAGRIDMNHLAPNHPTIESGFQIHERWKSFEIS